jgi:hypothetical protein
MVPASPRQDRNLCGGDRPGLRQLRPRSSPTGRAKETPSC